MLDLKESGYLHNRCRLLVSSFLTKNLLVSWKWGADWFWEQLLDADIANNYFSWQWMAGCGFDNTPYIRILNSEQQEKKFDLNTKQTYVDKVLKNNQKYNNTIEKIIDTKKQYYTIYNLFMKYKKKK